MYFEQFISDSEYSNLSDEFLSALNGAEYSSILHYTDSGHTAINKTLSGIVEQEPAINEIISDIDSALTKATPKKRLLYRGASLKEFKPDNGTITFKSYFSASYSPVQASKFIKSETKPVVYVIESEHGAEVSSIHDELEVLMPRDLTFTIVDVKENIEYTSLYFGTDYGVSVSNVTVVFLAQPVDK